MRVLRIGVQAPCNQ